LKRWAARRSIRTRPADGRLLKGRALRLVAIEVGYSDQSAFQPRIQALLRRAAQRCDPLGSLEKTANFFKKAQVKEAIGIIASVAEAYADEAGAMTGQVARGGAGY